MTTTRHTAEQRPLVALGVTGSIAAYKAADLTSRLLQAGIEVQVLMTRNAMRLVQPQTFLTLSRRPVITDLWEMPDWQPGHIALAEQARVLAVAPATACILAKMAHGIADDALSTYALSHGGAVIVAPAMNPRMWSHPAVKANCRCLRRRGARFVGPGAGRVACGEEGLGRLAPVEEILAAILDALGPVPVPPPEA
ncbi:MAG: phosphopantothenoylcysteine decarboxylase [Lentisphaeria bacterium]|nr:phosphopantothenoylcysteine decarboxylase [Lentisphaeria bacterium]